MIKMNSKITIEQVRDFLKTEYRLEATISNLPGDTDVNFKVEAGDGRCFILKVITSEETPSFLDFQSDVIAHCQSKNLDVNLPFSIKNTKGDLISTINYNGTNRPARLLSWVEGRLWAKMNPKTATIRCNLGEKGGLLTASLKDFDHQEAHYKSEWDLANASWTINHVHLFDEKKKTIVAHFQNQFKGFESTYKSLPKSIVHNDVNNYNVLVSVDVVNPTVAGIIDFGDVIYTQTINDLAILLAYAIMDVPDPLDAALDVIKGYHTTRKISETELEHLYTLIAMRLITTVTKTAVRRSEGLASPYHIISEQPAWDLLTKWFDVDSEFAYYSFRNACGYKAHPAEVEFVHWAENQKVNFSDLFPSEKKEDIHLLNLKPSSTWIGGKNEFNNLDQFEFKIAQIQKEYPTKLIAGGYCEPRPLYTSSDYDKEGNSGPESRTVHLGIDFWLPMGTPVHALYDGEVFTATNDAGYKEYGGLIILKHLENNLTFYTLHGHLSIASSEKLTVGDTIKKGECIGYLGSPEENGSWAPHLHFQLMLSILDYTVDFPGVAYVNKTEVWKSLCPDPNTLFKNASLETVYDTSISDILAFRKNHLGKSLSVSYKDPLHIVRGDGAYLIDNFGRKYLDTVNNVAHVGHEHPEVVKAGQDQMSVLNTNSRYLNEAINKLADELISTLPPELNVIHFVNSGSEANELAIRMVKAATGQRDIIASEVGYHGNTNTCVDISSYKFDGKGGLGAPKYTHIFPLTDSFRGKYRGDNTGKLYANEVQKQIDKIHSKERKVGAFIIEPIISCGGQIELPKDFLAMAYEKVRAANGLCISDEVQTGCGRMGSTFWGFQLYNVTPDIVTIGKPLGNGHPIAAVACTQDVANKFANGMEYFNTFGGNPVSCAIANEVLQTVKREKLQENATEVGAFLKSELRKLQAVFPIIGDVRGHGLFLGFELVDSELNPLPEQTSYLANRMKDFKILMSTDGPDNNVLKIKPPMVFSKENAKELIFRLKMVFEEDFMSFKTV